MPKLTWLHLSDLHFRTQPLRSQTQGLYTWDEDIVLRSLPLRRAWG